MKRKMLSSEMKRGVRIWTDKLINIAFGCCVLSVVWLLLQVTTLTSFKIPSDSMEPTLLPGDNILVNKWIMGGRVFDVWEMADGKETDIKRLPGFGDIERNDVLVFNFPYPERWDSIGYNVMLYYVKRCIGLPGDSVEIRDAHYHVRGYEGTLGHRDTQDRYARYLSEERNRRWMMEADCFRAYSGSNDEGWNVRDMGPFYLPATGDTIPLNELHYKLYRNLIEWEQRKKLTCKDGGFYLGGERIERYVFQQNYYFVAGDNCFNSQDSRYWGLLPEEHIVGKATRIWKSVNRQTDEVRWDRIFKEIK